MRNRFDQLGKQIGQEALGPSGPTIVHDEISPDAQHADLRHEPDPAREAERARLGLLGRLASILCLIEIYGHAPDEDEVLACVGKLIAFRQMRARSLRQKRARNARRQEQTETPTNPFLWIIAAGRPAAVLAKLGPSSAPGWPQGVYFSAGLFRVGVVVASELPRDRSTLLVRLMAAGPLLPQAIEDLSALPADAYERAVAEQILLNLQHALGKKPSRTPEEQEFIVTMQHTWEKARDDGQLDGVRLSLRRVFAARKLTPNPTEDAQIDACADLATLERWLDRALAAQSVAEVLRVGAVGSAKARRRTTRSL